MQISRSSNVRNEAEEYSQMWFVCRFWASIPSLFTADQLEETQPCNKEGDWQAELDLKRACAHPLILPRSDEGQRQHGDHGYYSNYHYKETK